MIRMKVIYEEGQPLTVELIAVASYCDNQRLVSAVMSVQSGEGFDALHEALETIKAAHRNVLERQALRMALEAESVAMHAGEWREPR